MNVKILTLLMATLIVLTPLAMAIGTPDPKGFTVKFETLAPLTTDFSVQTKTEQLNFSASPNTANALPEGGNPWGNITNGANQLLSFSVKLDSLPTSITLKMGCSDGTIGSCGGPSDLIDVGTTAASPIGWTNVPISGKVDIVAIANYGASSAGLQTKTITIESAAPP